MVGSTWIIRKDFSERTNLNISMFTSRSLDWIVEIVYCDEQFKKFAEAQNEIVSF